MLKLGFNAAAPQGRILGSIFSFKKPQFKSRSAITDQDIVSLTINFLCKLTWLWQPIYSPLIPPLLCSQPVPAWTTFRVGLFCGLFLALNVTVILSGEYPQLGPSGHCTLFSSRSEGLDQSWVGQELRGSVSLSQSRGCNLLVLLSASLWVFLMSYVWILNVLWFVFLGSSLFLRGIFWKCRIHVYRQIAEHTVLTPSLREVLVELKFCIAVTPYRGGDQP